eukprot:2664924-Ditylum_brightwellii.AAC.1
MSTEWGTMLTMKMTYEVDKQLEAAVEVTHKWGGETAKGFGGLLQLVPACAKLLHLVLLSSISSGDQCLKLSIAVSLETVETKSNETKQLLNDTAGDLL